MQRIRRVAFQDEDETLQFKWARSGSITVSFIGKPVFCKSYHTSLGATTDNNYIYYIYCK